MTIVALDIATITGWARVDRAGRVTHGTLTLPQTIAPDGLRNVKHAGARPYGLVCFLAETHAAEPIEHICWEDAFRQPGRAAAVYQRLVGAMLAWAAEHQIPCLPVGVTQIKKHAAAHGHADKQAMIAAVNRLGHFPADDNAADALNLLFFVLRTNPHICPKGLFAELAASVTA